MLKSLEPGICLEILSSVYHVNLTRGVADIALRAQPPNQPELICLHEIISEQGVYVSKQYADTLQEPCSWADLDCVAWSSQFRHVLPSPMVERIILDSTSVFSSDD
ncbi:MAG: DNA-binding transcriptional LysR family regulator [Oleiphilaceae bacterium]|jgi:DNA-binding transcriptional LysR family regulator